MIPLSLIAALSLGASPDSPTPVAGFDLFGRQGYWSVAFSPDAKKLAGGGDGSGLLKVWDLATNKTLLAVQTGSREVWSVCFSPDGKNIATGDDAKKVTLWDAATGARIKTFEGHTDSLRSVAFSPNGKLLASAGFDRKVILWDIASGQPKATLPHIANIWSVTFSADGARLASAGISSDDYVKVWDVESGKELLALRHERSPTGPLPRTSSAAFSPDGKTLACGQDGATVLWDLTTGKQLRKFGNHKNIVRSVAFTPHGTILASASNDKTIKIWDVSSGKELGVFSRHSYVIPSLAISSDGTKLASASWGVRIWDLTPFYEASK